ncbi:MAG: GNAT family N-acetyltransferase [Actinobacteria bacterium]|nr:GNAT family N-acetyltransferase [Actinomycetota bacterium]
MLTFAPTITAPADRSGYRGVRFGLDDLGDLLAVCEQAIRTHWAPGHDGAVRRSVSVERWTEALTDGVCLGFRRYDGSIAAAASLRTSLPAVHAFGNFVEDAGRGLGSALLAHRIELGRELGSESITVDVLGWNHRSQAMIERLGFRWERSWESEWEPGQTIHGYRLRY